MELILLLLVAALLLWALWPRVSNTARGFLAGQPIGTARAFAFIVGGRVTGRITKEVTNYSRERPGQRRYRRFPFARRGNRLGWRIGWVNNDWEPVPAADVQFQDLLGPGQTFVPGSAQFSTGQGTLIPVPDELITGGQIFSMADIPGATAELPGQTTAFIYLSTRVNFRRQAGAGQSAPGNQPPQGHLGHDPNV